MNGDANTTSYNNGTANCPIDCCCNQNGKCFLSQIILSQCPCINTAICLKFNYIPAIIGASISIGVILIIMGILLIYWRCRRPISVNPSAPNPNSNAHSSNEQSQSQQQNQTSQNSNWHQNHRLYPHPSAVLPIFARNANPNATTNPFINNNNNNNNNNSRMNLHTYPYSSPVQFFAYNNPQDNGIAKSESQDEVAGHKYKQNALENEIKQERTDNIQVQKFQDNSQIQSDQ